MSKLNKIIKVAFYFFSIKGGREWLKLQEIPIDSPLSTFAMAAFTQKILATWTSHWPMFIILKNTRLLSSQWEQKSQTLLSWIILYTFISWNNLQSPKNNLNHPDFNRLTSSFICPKGVEKMRYINKYNAGLSSEISFVCDSQIHHPNMNCKKNAIELLKNSIIKSLKLYVPAYTLIGLFRYKKRILDNPLILIKFVLVHLVRSTGYVIAMSQGNRSIPCLMSKYASKRIKKSQKCQILIFTTLTSIFTTWMYFLEHRSQRKVIFDFTLSYALLGILNKLPISQEYMTSFITGLAFCILHIQHNNTKIKENTHTSFISNLSTFLFDFKK